MVQKRTRLILTLSLVFLTTSKVSADLSYSTVEAPHDPWEVGLGAPPKFSLSCQRVPEAYYAPVTAAAAAESVEKLQNSPIVALDRADTFRLLGLSDPGNGTALTNLLTTAIQHMEREKQAGLGWNLSAQELLDSLIAQRQNANLTGYLVRATRHELGNTSYGVTICGDTLWVSSANSPPREVPITGQPPRERPTSSPVLRTPLVVFLNRMPPPKFYLDRRAFEN